MVNKIDKNIRLPFIPHADKILAIVAVLSLWGLDIYGSIIFIVKIVERYLSGDMSPFIVLISIIIWLAFFVILAALGYKLLYNTFKNKI